MNIDAGRYWDKAWTLVDGCTPVSAGCANCWSAGMTHRFKQGLTDDKGRWTGEMIIRESRLELPFRTKKPTVWAVWNDLFHVNVPIDFIANVFDVMASWRFACKKKHEHDEDCKTEDMDHTYLILTKHPERMKKIIDEIPAYIDEKCGGDTPLSLGVQYGDWPLKNIYLGTTVENQQAADERIPHLLQIPGKKFLSIEPVLSDIIIPQEQMIEQVILGGETGPKARPLHPDWVRSVRDQCQESRVPFFFKGWGTYKAANDWTIPAGRILDGKTHDDLAWSKTNKCQTTKS